MLLLLPCCYLTSDKMKTTKRQDGPVALRQKPLANGGASLYLDVYINGRRSYEFLKLHVVPELTREDKARNRETLALANAIRAKRIVEVQNGAYGFRRPAKVDLLSFFDQCLDERKKTRPDFRSSTSWLTCRRHLEDFGAGRVGLASLTSEWINDFFDHLRGAGLCESSAAVMSAHLFCCLRMAMRKDLVPQSVLANVSRPRMKSAERQYLTIDEVRLLAATESDKPSIKAAFLFSCLTGLRASDVRALRWEDVTEFDGMTRLVFRQRKTGSQEYLDISPQAVEYMGERRADERAVFDIPKSDLLNMALRRWVAAAGVRKRITFHCARHTFATLMLSLDVDIYTVSKLLGHANIATTQIYAKIVDKRKQQAVMRIPKI